MDEGVVEYEIMSITVNNFYDKHDKDELEEIIGESSINIVDIMEIRGEIALNVWMGHQPMIN